VFPGFPIRWYGVTYFLGLAVVYGLIRLQLREAGVSPRLAQVTHDETADLFFWTFLGLLLGSRIVTALVYETSGIYREHPWMVVWPFDGEMNFVGLRGMSYHGGLVGAVAALAVYCRIKHMPFLETADIAAAAVPLGYALGRVGNFINAELYGRITSAPWGVIFPTAEWVPADHPAVERAAAEIGLATTDGRLVNVPRHPSQIYEAIGQGIVLWAVLWFWVRRRRPFSGAVAGFYILAYGVVRFVLEYFRAPDPGLGFVVEWGSRSNPLWLFESLGNLTIGQVLSAAMLAIGAAMLGVLRYRAGAVPRVETYEVVERSKPQNVHAHPATGVQDINRHGADITPRDAENGEAEPVTASGPAASESRDAESGDPAPIEEPGATIEEPEKPEGAESVERKGTD
jgi:phosphatidylglycerol:prolipoprotein diacylglycerol transferase